MLASFLVDSIAREHLAFLALTPPEFFTFPGGGSWGVLIRGPPPGSKTRPPKSVIFSSFSLGIEGQKRVLRVFEILINISTIITEIEGFIIKNTKRGGIPS